VLLAFNSFALKGDYKGNKAIALLFRLVKIDLILNFVVLINSLLNSPFIHSGKKKMFLVMMLAAKVFFTPFRPLSLIWILNLKYVAISPGDLPQGTTKNKTF